MQVQLGSSHMGGTSLEVENVNEHYKHAVADDHAVACHTLCCTWTRCHTPKQPGEGNIAISLWSVVFNVYSPVGTFDLYGFP